MIPQLGVDVLLEHHRAVVILCVRGVVPSAVGEHPLHVRDEEPLVAVVVGLQPLPDREQVHRVLDPVVVVGDDLAVDGVEEGPGRLVVLHPVEDRLEGVVEGLRVLLLLGVAGDAAGLVRGLVAGLEDAGDALDGDLLDAVAEAGEAGVDLADLVLLPLDQLLEDLLLLAHDRRELGVDDLRVQFAAWKEEVDR